MIAKRRVTPEGLLRLVESFESFGVTKRAIEARLGRRIDAIAPAQYLRLREIYASLRDGMSPTSPNRRRKRTRRRRRPKKSRRPSRRKRLSEPLKARSRRARKRRRATRRRPTLLPKRRNRKRRRFNRLASAEETANFSAPRPLKRFASDLSTRRRSTNCKRQAPKSTPPADKAISTLTTNAKRFSTFSTQNRKRSNSSNRKLLTLFF